MVLIANQKWIHRLFLAILPVDVACLVMKEVLCSELLDCYRFEAVRMRLLMQLFPKLLKGWCFAFFLSRPEVVFMNLLWYKMLVFLLIAVLLEVCNGWLLCVHLWKRWCFYRIFACTLGGDTAALFSCTLEDGTVLATLGGSASVCRAGVPWVSEMGCVCCSFSAMSSSALRTGSQLED